MGGNTAAAVAASRLREGAAMEPPGNGRKHADSAAFHSLMASPQWSRPVMGGNTSPSPRRTVPPRWPQWSRPVMGGNTLSLSFRRVAYPRAAMEPPGNGRKHPVAGRQPQPVQRAAMEPPGNGRKHRPGRPGTDGRIVPQWSRPVMGGNTLQALEQHGLHAIGAAMEPPGNGRKHPPAHQVPVPLVPRRNGAAR